MAHIKAFELYTLDLPFRKPFKHAAAERSSSNSLMLKCVTDTGVAGFGESLPREYVTGESRDGAFELLKDGILPRLLDRGFNSLDQVKAFLAGCNGKAPAEWIAPSAPQTAAWAAVDLALLDAFGRAFDEPVRIGGGKNPDPNFRYSVVVSGDRGLKLFKSLILMRLFGFRQVKLKIDTRTAEVTARWARRIFGKGRDLRADANMAWTVDQAREAMMRLARYGVRSFEQPIPAEDLQGLAALVRDTGLGVMADESLSDGDSLERLIAAGACTAVNVRISKCGGLVASHQRCLRSLEAGLTVQVGCQVGETSLLSAAQLILIAAVGRVTYGEGCFGLHLLKEDPVAPLMQFGYGGKPPPLPGEPGLGVQVDEAALHRWSGKKETVGPA